MGALRAYEKDGSEQDRLTMGAVVLALLLGTARKFLLFLRRAFLFPNHRQGLDSFSGFPWVAPRLRRQAPQAETGKRR
ncbi:hypothetical protein MPNT_150035 [Candidatus Methylacidithermus pantelleriae]|uniref:Uncharacterized protein n=1 Tax=Candidatus Methylacidithermus pantelleriae TaxID=2744239 RepID=A0A8J2BMU4_9BACT|nr:hypothetical protein MPNT_150035 [Candidatus Methylacidithermus pantelleriae]